MVVSFFKRSAEFNWYVYDPLAKVIENTFDDEEKYETNSDFSFTNYDMIFTLKDEFYCCKYYDGNKSWKINGVE